MARDRRGSGRKLALVAGSLLAAAAMPGTVLAVGLLEDGIAFSAGGSFASFTPGNADPAMAEMLAGRSGGAGQMMRFTPAGSDSMRAVTVAVRIDQQVAQAISGNSAIDGQRTAGSAESGLRLAPTRYNLGLARGYRSFAQAPALASSLAAAEIPDLATFRPTPGVADEQSRFAAQIALDEERTAARTAEAVERQGDQLLDVGGSYRLTRNLNVRAGLRYQQDRDVLPDMAQQDSQAVYIGTQFRF